MALSSLSVESELKGAPADRVSHRCIDSAASKKQPRTARCVQCYSSGEAAQIAPQMFEPAFARLVLRRRCRQFAGKAKNAGPVPAQFENFSTISGAAQRQRAQNRRAQSRACAWFSASQIHQNSARNLRRWTKQSWRQRFNSNPLRLVAMLRVHNMPSETRPQRESPCIRSFPPSPPSFHNRVATLIVFGASNQPEG